MKSFKWLFFVWYLVLVFACNSDNNRYYKLVEEELSKGVRHDSLFMGIKLGMTSKEFYTHCWKMNKKGIFFEGLSNTTVLYRFKNELKHPATMNFYPDFQQNKINRMRVNVNYDAFAPWNKNLYADSLQLDLLNLFKKWYPGTNFMKIMDKDRGTIFVQVQGNRRIIIGKYDEQNIKVDYTDLLTDKKFTK